MIRRTNAFLKDYRALPAKMRERVDKQLRLLLEDFRHPSLRLKKLSGTDKFEIRVSKGYRLTLRIQKDGGRAAPRRYPRYPGKRRVT